MRSNYIIHLLRKALEKNGYGFIPVISLNFSGLESNPGFKLTKTMLVQVAYALLIGDLIMMVANQCRPYEVVPGSTDKAIDICMDAVIKRFTGERMVRYGEVKHLFRFVLTVFSKLKLDKTQKKKLVGIVGEIYVKFSPLGNNRLEEFLLSELRAGAARSDGLLPVLHLQLGHRPRAVQPQQQNRRHLQDGVPVCARQTGRYHQNDEERRSFPSADAV